MQTQQEIEPHFLVLVICAAFFTVGVLMYVVNFFKYGKPTDEALAIEA